MDVLKHAGLIVVLACAACTSDGDSPPSAESADIQAEPPYIAVNQVERPLLPASITNGVLTAKDGCVVFSASGKEFTPVWPKGTKIIQESGAYLIAYRDKKLKIGDQIALPGGPFSLMNKEDLQVDGEIPARCPKDIYAVG